MTTYPHPACMEPDGGDGPCAGYQSLEKRRAHLEAIAHAANTYIGMARLHLSHGNVEEAGRRLDQYCAETDRLEVRYLGHDRAAQLLASGIIHPTPAYADEIAKLAAT